MTRLRIEDLPEDHDLDPEQWRRVTGGAKQIVFSSPNMVMPGDNTNLGRRRFPGSDWQKRRRFPGSDW